MPFPEISRPSPHFSASPAHERCGVCFHHSDLSFATTIAHMQNAASAVSYHCLIDTDGTRATLVTDDRIAWHAGVSTFCGRSRCNDFLLGVAFAGNTYTTPLTAAQLESALEWLAVRWAGHRWTAAWMTDHRQIAPGRKDDLNPAEWARLFDAITARFSG